MNNQAIATGTLHLDYRELCELCGSREFYILLSKSFTEEPLLSLSINRYRGKITEKQFSEAVYEVRKCKSCGFIFQPYVPSGLLAKELYTYEESRINQSLNKKKKALLTYYMHNAVLAEKAGILVGKSPAETKVLDYGMGWGYFLQMAKAHGYEVVGFEISRERQDYAKNNCIAFVDSFDKLDGKKFDYIHADQVFEHITDPVRHLKKLVEHLEDTGVLYIAVPNGNKAERQIKISRDIIDIVYPLEHINCFNHELLIQLGKKVGLTAIQPTIMFRRFARSSSLRHHLNFFVEAFKGLYTQNKSTAVYFIKSGKI